MAVLLVRGLDDQLYKALGARAVRDKRSISQETAWILEAYLSRPYTNAPSPTRRLLELAGAWDEESPAEEIAARIREARRPGQRFGRYRRDRT